MIRLWQILLLAVIIGITWVHKKRFAANKPIGPWWHLWWGFVYAVPAAFIAWRCHSWWLIVAFTLERFVFYNWILNLLRGKPFFYIVADNSKPGFWDKIEVWWKDFYPYIWGVSVLIFIIIQFMQQWLIS